MRSGSSPTGSLGAAHSSCIRVVNCSVVGFSAVLGDDAGVRATANMSLVAVAVALNRKGEVGTSTKVLAG
jgi:hypothetical protein